MKITFFFFMLTKHVRSKEHIYIIFSLNQEYYDYSEIIENEKKKLLVRKKKKNTTSIICCQANYYYLNIMII